MSPHATKSICVTAALTLLSYTSTITNVSGFLAPPSWGLNTVQTQIAPFNSQTSLHAMRRGGRPRGPIRTIEKKPPMNQEIKYDTLRVVTPNPKGKDDALGVMSKAEALAKAKSMGGLDLILINPNSDPVVCKIADYSKYRYEKEKKAKDVKKKSKSSELKEVKMSYKIDVHDYGVRMKSATKFLKQGNRVKCTVQFKGREMQHSNLGQELLVKMSKDLEGLCSMEGKPKKEGRSMSSILSPKPDILKGINDKKRAEERATRREKEATQKIRDEKKALEGASAGTAAAVAEDEKSDVDEDSVANLLGGDDSVDDLFG